LALNNAIAFQRGLSNWTRKCPASSASMNNHPTPSLLVIGYGNELRGDDAVGPAVAVALEELKLEGVRVLVRHQLTPELAERVSQADAVVFADAVMNGDRTVRVRELTPADASGILTHACDPRSLLGLAGSLFEHCPRAWSITVPIETTTFGEPLSPAASQGAALALAQIKNIWSRLRRECQG